MGICCRQVWEEEGKIFVCVQLLFMLFHKVLVAVLFVVFTFGMISSFAPNFPCLLLFRGLVGFGAGGGFLA